MRFPYSHKDYEDTAVVRQVFTHLYGLKQSFPDLGIWIDQRMIRVGDQWLPEIDEALAAADLAVLIISPEFLASPFIMEKEPERLLRRSNQTGLRLVPILLKPCGWPTWLAATEIRPRGDRALSEIHAKDPSAVDRALKQVIEEIEEQMRRDDTGAYGWLIECEPEGDVLRIFGRLGFREIALAYKEFGAVYAAARLGRDELRETMRDGFAIIYGIDGPERHALFAALEAQMRAWPTPAVEWRRRPA